MTPETGLQIVSLVKSSGELELSLAKAPVARPQESEVLVRVEAAPINPSDLGLLLGPADIDAGKASGAADSPVFTAPIPARAMRVLAARVGEPMPVGVEGAGVVIEAGASAAAQALLGKRVALAAGGMFAQYRCVPAAACLVLPDGVTAAEGASAYVNPMTVLGMIETMRREGHKALIHTAAASNLGKMLAKACAKENIPLVAIVRSSAQADQLRELGVTHICDSTAPGFREDLTRAIAATGATLAFDAISGGKIVGQILSAMEAALSADAAYSRYGSSVHKQVYIYGVLDPGPIEIHRDFGMAWGVGGWLLTYFLQKAGLQEAARMRARVAAEITTTFASSYARVISLREALRPETIAAYAKRATGEKFLINPSLDG